MHNTVVLSLLASAMSAAGQSSFEPPVVHGPDGISTIGAPSSSRPPLNHGPVVISTGVPLNHGPEVPPQRVTINARAESTCTTVINITPTPDPGCDCTRYGATTTSYIECEGCSLSVGGMSPTCALECIPETVDLGLTSTAYECYKTTDLPPVQTDPTASPIGPESPISLTSSSVPTATAIGPESPFPITPRADTPTCTTTFTPFPTVDPGCNCEVPGTTTTAYLDCGGDCALQVNDQSPQCALVCTSSTTLPGLTSTAYSCTGPETVGPSSYADAVPTTLKTVRV